MIPSRLRVSLADKTIAIIDYGIFYHVSPRFQCQDQCVIVELVARSLSDEMERGANSTVA